MKIQTPILITGASGFIGANLLRRLTDEISPKKVHIILRKNSSTWRIENLLKKIPVHVVNLQSQSETNSLLQKIKPKTIFHLAAHGAYPYQMDEKEIIDTNIIGTFNLIQACLQVDFYAFINTGTSSEYGVNQKPMGEEDMLRPISAYGVSKTWATLYGQYLALVQKAPITTLRLFGVYGFFEPKGRLIPNIILALIKKRQPTIVSPDFARDFVFVEDVVSAYLKAAEYKSSQPVFNVGSGQKTTLKKIFYSIKNIMGAKLEPIWENNAGGLFDVNYRIANIESAKKYLGWGPSTNLDSGLKQTVDWFKKNLALYQ